MTAQDSANALLAILPRPFGAGTFRLNADTVKAFQAAYNADKSGSLGVDGVLGPATLKALGEYVALPPVAPGVVDGVATIVDGDDMAASIGRGYQHVTGGLPSYNMLRMLTSQAFLETASGRRMNNYNFGNVHGKTASGQSAVLPDKDASGGVYYTNFRAYDSLDDGAADYVRLITTGYSNTLPFAEAGDIQGFASALKSKGYYESPQASYAAGLIAMSGTAGIAAKNWTPSENGGELRANPTDDSPPSNEEPPENGGGMSAFKRDLEGIPNSTVRQAAESVGILGALAGFFGLWFIFRKRA